MWNLSHWNRFRWKREKLGRCCHDPGGNYDLCAQSDAGGILAESMPMSQAIWSGVIGYAVIVALMIFCGIMGSDLGVPTCVVASGVFGKQGSSKLISALFMISMIGWFAVQNGVCGSAFSNLIEASTGVKILIPVSTVVWGIIMLIKQLYMESMLWIN